MTGRRLRRIGATLVTVVGLTVIAALATGEVKLVTTHGISMEPRFHTGDLAVVVPSAHYRVGEIVGYHSPLLHIVVLHRIVAEKAGLFTFKGDNNSFLDPRRLPPSAIEGRLWLHVPRGGEVLGWVRYPVVLGFLAFLVVLLGVVGGVSRRRERVGRSGPGAGSRNGDLPRPEPAAVGPAKNSAPSAQPALWWPVGFPLILAAALGMLALAAFAQPVTRSIDRPVSYHQLINFSYGGTAAPGITYPTGAVVSPNPVFVHLVKTLDVKARYTFDATEPGMKAGARTDLSGTIGAIAVLRGPQGWQSQLAIVAPVRFSGPTARVDVPVDLSRITTLEKEFAQETGLPLETPVVTVTPTIRVRGTFDGAALAGHFAPSLPLQANGEVLSLASAGSGTSLANYPELTPHVTGTVNHPVKEPAQMSIVGHSMGVATARHTGLIGAVVLVILALVGGSWVVRRRRMDEPDRIRAAYGHELVKVSASPAGRAPLVVDVETFDQLAHLARRYDCVILEYSEGAHHAYYVESGTTVYRCGVEPSPTSGLRSVDLPDRSGAILTMPMSVEGRREPVLSTAITAQRFSGVPWPKATAEEGQLVAGSFFRPWGRAGRAHSRRANGALDMAAEVDLLTCLGRAEWVSGVGDAGADLRRAAIMARNAGLDRGLIEALTVNVRTSFDAEQDSDPEKIELLEYSLASHGLTPALRARILGALAVELVFEGDSTSRGPMLDEARELARASGDAKARVDVSACEFWARPRSSWSSGRLDSDRLGCDDVVDLAVILDDPLEVATIQNCAASYALLVGDGEQLRAHVESLATTSRAARTRWPGAPSFACSRRSPHWMGAWVTPTPWRPKSMPWSATPISVTTAQGMPRESLRCVANRIGLEELRALFTVRHNSSRQDAVSAAVLAFLAAETGDRHEATILLERAMGRGIGAVPDDADWPLAMAMLAEVAALVGDREAAVSLHESVARQDGTQMWSDGILCGPAARLLAKLEHTLGWTDHADWHFAEAIESGRRLESPVWTARCQLDWASTWIERGEIVRAVQLIYAADAAMDAHELPALERQASMLKRRLGPT